MGADVRNVAEEWREKKIVCIFTLWFVVWLKTKKKFECFIVKWNSVETNVCALVKGNFVVPRNENSDGDGGSQRKKVLIH